MYSNQNLISSKASFTSVVLAQAKLLGITKCSNEATSLDIQAISNNTIRKIEQKTNASVSEVLTFYQPITAVKVGGLG